MKYGRIVKKSGESGMTLVEIMVVVMIIALIGTFVGINALKRLDQAKLEAVKVQIGNLEGALDTFKMDNGYYPSTEQGLEALVSEPTSGRIPKHYPSDGYLKKLPKDPWDNTYSFRYPGVKNPSTFDIWSNGPDGEEGSEDDITNWEE